MRIGIAGCAGTGKSLLGKRLSVKLDMPFLASKQITGPILERDGYDYASGQQVERFLATQERQKEILKGTTQQQSLCRFVTGRTAIDLAAYAILEMDDPTAIKRHLDQCAQLCAQYTHIFFCPWANKEPADNHRRTLDPWYQFSVHAVELQVADFLTAPLYRLRTSTVDDRIQEIMEILEA